MNKHYKTELDNYIKLHPDWDGTIIRKENVILYKWYKEIINGRRKLKNDDKQYFTNKGLKLEEMVCNYNRYLKFKDWLVILEDYLNTYYYYGIKNEFRKDKKHISEWDGTLKRHAGNFKNNNLYEWHRKIKKRNLKDSELVILNSLGLKLNNKISDRLTFDEWVNFLKEYKEHIGDKWNGIIKTNTFFKNRNIYTFLNAIRHKTISNEQELILKDLGLRNYKIN